MDLNKFKAALVQSGDLPAKHLTNDQLKDYANHLSEQLTYSFAPAIDALRKAAVELSGIWFEYVCSEYLRFHDRLPGGTSNARLQKKRRTKVLAWYESRYC